MMIISLMTLGLIQLIVMAVIMSGILLDVMHRLRRVRRTMKLSDSSRVIKRRRRMIAHVQILVL